MTVVDYVVVGVGARTLGRQHAERVALRSGTVAVLLNRHLRPAAAAADPARQRAHAGPGLPDGPFTSEAELRDLVDLAEERRSSRSPSGR